MPTTKYIVTEVPTGVVNQQQAISNIDQPYVNDFSINSFYDQNIHDIHLHVYSTDNVLLLTDLSYNREKQLENSAGAGREGASTISINPESDALSLGYTYGGVILYYNFIDNLYRIENNLNPSFFIESISSDRTEVRVIPLTLAPSDLEFTTLQLANKLNLDPSFNLFYINLGDNNFSTVVNIDVQDYKDTKAVILKLYEPLPATVTVKEEIFIVDKVSDSVAFEITAETVEDVVTTPQLKGPNFDIEITEESTSPTQYYNFNELFSYPVSNSYYELRSLINENSAYISLDHNDFENFVHFSSAEERIKNFKYKLDLIHSYESYLETTGSIAYSEIGISGSREYYGNLITGIVENFDHYDRFLYYESGSNSWPKSNSTRPFVNVPSTDSAAVEWYSDKILSSSFYDSNNLDRLVNTIPAFLREDDNNAPYLTFVDMVGQHFDNLWIYTKQISDKYDGDNRLDRGISRDLVKDALVSFGVNIKESTQDLQNIFSVFTGEAYNTGSEQINNFQIITSGSSNEYLQPMPEDFYTKEVYKRIYHNIPLLLKSKGTERGIKALINCFGIPTDLLEIKYFGGNKKTDDDPYLGPYFPLTSSLDKIRVDNTGSFTQGDTLSPYTSIFTEDNKYSVDVHTLEIGFSTSDPINNYIKEHISASFDLDDYIGDPRQSYSGSYDLLNTQSDSLLFSNISNYNIFNLVRLIKFFDNRIFKSVKDFLPARSNVNTGVIVNPHVLNRSKIKQVRVGLDDVHNYSGSINISSITGSSGGSYPRGAELTGSFEYPTGIYEYSTSHSLEILTPFGPTLKQVSDESPKYNGELNGSLVIVSETDLNDQNIYKYISPGGTSFKINISELGDCGLEFGIY